MQYANSRLSLKLNDFEAILAKINDCPNKHLGGSLYGYESDRNMTVEQISVSDEHAEYAESEHIKLLQANDPMYQYLGEWFYHPDFNGWIDERYEKIMQKKSAEAEKLQQFTSPAVILLDIVDGDIIAVAEQFDLPFKVDLSVHGADRIEYLSQGLKLVKTTLI